MSAMAALVAVMTGLLTFVRPHIGIAVEERNAERARHYARVGLERAIAAVQRDLGPDTRVSAAGSFRLAEPRAPESAEAWLGVWDSAAWDPAEPLERAFIGWLVSGATAIERAGGDPGTPPEMARFQVDGKTVSAPWIRISPTVGGYERTVGRFAWWVGDESQKVRLNLQPTADTTVPAIAGLEALWPGRDVSLDATALAAVIARGQTAHLEARAAWPLECLTVDSRAVLCDVRRGGLRTDLVRWLFDDPSADLNRARPIVSFGDVANADALPPPTWALVASQLAPGDRLSQRDGKNLALPTPPDRLPRPYGVEWEDGTPAYPERAGTGPVLLRALVRLGVARDRFGSPALGYQVAVALWNPWDIALAEGDYALELAARPDGGFPLLGVEVGRAPAENPDGLAVAATRHIPLCAERAAEAATGERSRPLFHGEVRSGFAPGEVKVFSLSGPGTVQGIPSATRLEEGWRPDVFLRRELATVPVGEPYPRIRLLRLLDRGGGLPLGWRELHLRLTDAAGAPFQEIAGLGHATWFDQEGEKDYPDPPGSAIGEWWVPPPTAEAEDPPAIPEAPEPAFEPLMSAYYMLKTGPAFSSDAPRERTAWLAHHDPTAPVSFPGRYQYWPSAYGPGEPDIHPGNWNWRGGWFADDPANPFNPDAFLFPQTGYFPAAAANADRLALFHFPRARRTWTSLGQLRHLRLGIAAHEPAYLVGSSRAHPRLAPEAIIADEPPASAGWRKAPHREGLADTAWLLNEALWDRFYFFGEISGDAVLAAHPRLRPWSTRTPGRGGAGALALEGPFNVNTTDARAWAAFLASGLRDGRVPAGRGLAGEDGTHLALDPDIQRLAEAIAGQVRLRGPFMGLADFVNRRRLPAAQDPGGTALAGALEAALAETRRKADPLAAGVAPERGLVWYHDAHDTAEPFLDAPGTPNQADLLARLGPLLTARGDTFRVHVRAEVLNPLTGEVEASARCVATLQRRPQWLDPADPPEAAPDTLAPVNARFGRRFVVTRFDWQ